MQKSPSSDFFDYSEQTASRQDFSGFWGRQGKEGILAGQYIKD